MAPTPQPPWTPAVIESVADVLAATEWPGLSGGQIGQLLAQVRIDDPYPSITKRKRVAAALQNRQAHDGHSNRLVTFLTSAMDPGRFVRDPAAFDALRQDLSEVLSLCGLKINNQGKVAYAPQARTLDEVAALAGRLQGELKRRGVHPQAVHYCREELLRRSTFHAVFEATKGLAERLRQVSGMTTLDGDDLVTACFAGKVAAPVVQINASAPRVRSVNTTASPTCCGASLAPSAIPPPTSRVPHGSCRRKTPWTCFPPCPTCIADSTARASPDNDASQGAA